MPDYYGTIEQASAYHDARGNAAWAAADSSPDSARLAALVRASTWLDGRFGAKYPGKKTGGRSQLLGWPRSCARDVEGNAIADDEVPVEVLSATYEAALRELADPGSLSPDLILAERVISERVGPISQTYSDNQIVTATDMRPTVTLIDDIMSALVGAESNTKSTLLLRA
ncbi:DnaT-like ssDNA-binding protein [Hyphomicrobium sp. DY-1]|uniref:DnaT-like ssDNA-binding protein n=1 Tax=Hyphomicrobium sp. DY-1 TaxID=3075650 RepID=UPI0039C03662